MNVTVERRGGEDDAPPVSFRLGDTEYVVEAVLDRWFGADSTFFKTRASDGNLYILRHRESAAEGDWTLESFRRD